MLGFSPVGRLALGQVHGFEIWINVSGVAGVGRAGSIVTVAGKFGQVAAVTATGTAGTILISTTKPVLGVAGIGRAGTIVAGISGSGVSTRLIEERPRDKRLKTGFEPVNKRRVPPVPIEATKPPLPPFRDAPRAPLTLPVEARGLVPTGLLTLQSQIQDAQDIFDIEQYLRAIDG